MNFAISRLELECSLTNNGWYCFWMTRNSTHFFELLLPIKDESHRSNSHRQKSSAVSFHWQKETLTLTQITKSMWYECSKFNVVNVLSIWYENRNKHKFHPEFDVIVLEPLCLCMQIFCYNQYCQMPMEWVRSSCGWHSDFSVFIWRFKQRRIISWNLRLTHFYWTRCACISEYRKLNAQQCFILQCYSNTCAPYSIQMAHV